MAGINDAYKHLNRHLSGLCAFDLVARHGNFTNAAEALGITQPAISLRIKNLEADLGVVLFTRGHQGVEPTESGKQLLAVVRPALEQIGSSVSSLMDRRKKPQVKLSLDYAFASFWLLPILPRLREDLKEIDIQILASQTPVEVAGNDCDLIIHMAPRNNLGEGETLILTEAVAAVCSPNFLAENGPISSNSQLLGMPLLSLSGPDSAPWHTWQSWFATLNIDGECSGDFTSFSNYDLVIKAAVEGQGIALGWLDLIKKLLDEEKLVTVTDSVVTSEYGYVISQNQPNGSKVSSRVLDWIVDQKSNPAMA